MTPRERVITALSRKKPDKIPKNAVFTPHILELFRKKTKSENPAEYFQMECRYLTINPTKLKTDFSKYLPDNLPKDKLRIDEWGIGWIKGSMHHFEEMIHPMKNFTKLEEFKEYPYPDVTADYRKEGVYEKVKDLQKAEHAVAGVIPGVGTTILTTIFETAWRLRGMENMLIDMIANEDIAECLLDKITVMAEHNAKFLAECDVDILHTVDDVGTQRGMIMNPDLWRKWIKPRFKQVIDSAKKIKPEILVFYHSDGKIYDIIDDLIEIGVNVLNPVQPECMDPVYMKQKYGDKLSFWGTIGTQKLMPFGTPDEIKTSVKNMIETVGKNGGLLISPTHAIEPEVPWNNIEAFFEAVEEYGQYI